MGESQFIELTDNDIDSIGFLLREYSEASHNDGDSAASRTAWALAVKVDPANTQDEQPPWE